VGGGPEKAMTGEKKGTVLLPSDILWQARGGKKAQDTFKGGGGWGREKTPQYALELGHNIPL